MALPTLQVLCTKETVEPERLGRHVVIVVDILFATTTIVHAFAQGVESVWPALNSEEALVQAGCLSNALCAGEYLAEPLPGFASAMPLKLSGESLNDKILIYCTTNGTVALRGSIGAAVVYVGALLNGAALAAHIARTHPGAPILIVCAGSIGRFNLEDFYGAGHLVAHLQRLSAYDLGDAARAALAVYEGCDARSALMDSRVGQMMQARAMEHEVEYAAQRDTMNVVVRLDGAWLRRIAV